MGPLASIALTAIGLALFFLRYQGREISGWLFVGLAFSVAATAGFIVAV
jgi:hypothetical protein